MAASRLNDTGAVPKGLFGVRLGSERLDQLDHLAADLAVRNLHEGAIELQTFGGRQEIDDIIGTGRLGHAAGAGVMLAWGILEEEGNRDIENTGNILETACPDAVSALLVLLDLLKRNSEAFAELLLAHAKHGAAEAYAASDMNVDGVRLFFVLNHHITLT